MPNTPPLADFVLPQISQIFTNYSTNFVCAWLLIAKMEEFIYKDENFKIVGLCMEVHRILGSGLLEIVYKDALEFELRQHKIPYAREKEYLVQYKVIFLPHKFYADFVVYDDIILEVKSLSEISKEHLAQTINYVKLAKSRLGIIVNFGSAELQHKRIIL